MGEGRAPADDAVAFAFTRSVVLVVVATGPKPDTRHSFLAAAVVKVHANHLRTDRAELSYAFLVCNLSGEVMCSKRHSIM